MTDTQLKKQAFLEFLYNESFEDPYQGSSIDDVVNRISQQFNLSVEDQAYLYDKAHKVNPMFLENVRKER